MQTELGKLQIKISPEGRRVGDLDIAQRGLQDFGALVEALPMDDQKEPMKLPIEQIVVSPCDPGNGKAPSEEGAWTTRIRAKDYRVDLKLHQIPDLAGLR